MDHINNDPQQILIRKSQNTLIVVGSGIILFSVWSAARMLGLLFLLRDETVSGLRELMEGYSAILSDNVVFAGLLVIVALVLAVTTGIRTYVGLSAIAEGRGERRKSLYLWLAVILCVSNLLSIITNLASDGSATGAGALSMETSFSALIIDFTSMVMLLEMIISAVRIKKIRKQPDPGIEQKERT